MIFNFWDKLPHKACVHPGDKAVIDQHKDIFELHAPPGHINGQLKTAPIIALFLNPGFEDEGKQRFEDESCRTGFPLRSKPAENAGVMYLNKVPTLIKSIFLVTFVCLSGLACSETDSYRDNHNAEIVSVVIIGSAESPDPVLERVITLEQQGVLKNVVIMESFPVQIQLTGPANVVKELELIPRKK